MRQTKTSRLHCTERRQARDVLLWYFGRGGWLGSFTTHHWLQVLVGRQKLAHLAMTTTTLATATIKTVTTTKMATRQRRLSHDDEDGWLRNDDRNDDGHQ
jgi:hypothetical protein